MGKHEYKGCYAKWSQSAKEILYDSTYTRYLVKLETEGRTAVARGWGREKWVRGVQSCGDQLHKKVNITLLSCILKNGWDSGWLELLGSKITADGDCSHEIKRRLLLGRKVMTNLDSILKSRDITLPTKDRLVKAMVYPVVLCGCESWTIKKAEHWKIDAFELWCWRRLFRIPWTARRSNHSILKEISPGCSLEGLMLKLKLQ